MGTNSYLGVLKFLRGNKKMCREIFILGIIYIWETIIYGKWNIRLGAKLYLRELKYNTCKTNEKIVGEQKLSRKFNIYTYIISLAGLQ